jgi:hypothetical protein
VDPNIGQSRRRDAEGDFHDLIQTKCSDCGCTQFRAEDDPKVIWDPGSAWDEECSDRDCHCHTDPVIGMPRD